MTYDIKKRFSAITIFSVFILVLVSFGVISLVKHQTIKVQRQYISVEVTGKDWSNNFTQYDGYRPPFWLIKNLQIGAQELAPDGRVVAEIKDIEYYERSGGNAQVFLTVEIETINSFSSGKTVYKGSNIEVGEKIDLHFQNTAIVGQITNISDQVSPNVEEQLLVTGIYRSKPSYIVENLVPGMKIVNPFNNKIYASIESTKVTPSSQVVVSELGSDQRLSFRTDYSLRNLEMKVLLTTQKHLGINYFAGHQVIRVGGNVSLFFNDLLPGSMEITDVETYPQSSK